MKFLLTGHSGCYNRGCEAIVRSTLEMLRSTWKNSCVMLASRYPEQDRKTLSYEKMSIFRYPTSRFTKEWLIGGIFKRWPTGGQLLARTLERSHYCADVCLSIGGDNYTLDYGDPWMLVRDRITVAVRTPLVIWGASIGPFENNRGVKMECKELLASAKLITARESVTIEYLASLGITKNVVKVFDPAFVLKPEPFTESGQSFFKSQDIIGLNISALIAIWRADKSFEGLAREVSLFIEAATEKGYKVLLVPHVTKEGGELTINDEAALRYIFKLKGKRRNTRLLEPGLTAGQIKWVISKCRFFIGSRTHTTIAALSSAVPTISIAYSTKARGINRDIFEHEEYVLETSKVSYNSLLDKLKLLEQREDSIRRFLKDKHPEMIKGAYRNVDALQEVLHQ